MLRLKIDDFSRDPRVVAAMHADPLVANEVQPTLTVAEMVRADDRLSREFPLITLPVFILHGTDDKVTKPSGSGTPGLTAISTIHARFPISRRCDRARTIDGA